MTESSGAKHLQPAPSRAAARWRGIAVHCRNLRLVFLCVIFIVAALSRERVEAAPFSELDELAVQMVIVTQLQAFADDDALAAFATTTPGVREAIGSPLEFLSMVRRAYPMVYRATAVTFHKPLQGDDTVLQLLQITDEDGQFWYAMFELERQEDATWRIRACVVAETSSQML